MYRMDQQYLKIKYFRFKQALDIICKISDNPSIIKSVTGHGETPYNNIDWMELKASNNIIYFVAIISAFEELLSQIIRECGEKHKRSKLRRKSIREITELTFQHLVPDGFFCSESWKLIGRYWQIRNAIVHNGADVDLVNDEVRAFVKDSESFNEKVRIETTNG